MGSGRGCLLLTPQKDEVLPVFPAVGQLLQRHARYIASNGQSGHESTRPVQIEDVS